MDKWGYKKIGSRLEQIERRINELSAECWEAHSLTPEGTCGDEKPFDIINFKRQKND